MVAYLLNFHENIRHLAIISNSLIHQRKLLLYFLIHLKKITCNIRRIFMEQSGNIPIFNIPRTLFRNIPQNFIGNFLLNILGISHGNVPRIFHKHVFALWVATQQVPKQSASSKAKKNCITAMTCIVFIKFTRLFIGVEFVALTFE